MKRCCSLLLIFSEDVFKVGNQVGFHVFVVFWELTIIGFEIGDTIVYTVRNSRYEEKGAVVFPLTEPVDARFLFPLHPLLFCAFYKLGEDLLWNHQFFHR